VLRQYDFELVPGQKIEPRAMVILRPRNGIRMSFNSTSPADRATEELTTA
jgi:hypothetical protein